MVGKCLGSREQSDYFREHRKKSMEQGVEETEGAGRL